MLDAWRAPGSGATRVELVGRLAGGGTFVARLRARSCFWAEAGATARAGSLDASLVHASSRVGLDGAPLVRIEASDPGRLTGARRALEAAGVRCYEADVGLVTRFKLDRGIGSSIVLHGPSRRGPRGLSVFDESRIEPGDSTPDLSLVSLDIETDPGGSRLLSVALAGSGADEVHLLRSGGGAAPPPAIVHEDERALVSAVARRIVELDPDILTGWNVIDFDLAWLAARARRLAVPFELGRVPGPLTVAARRPGLASRARVPGRVVLDGPQLLRGSFVRSESYGLDAVARRVLGRGKLITGSDRAARILAAWHHDLPLFVDYNLTDARLVLEILERLRLVELTVERSRLTGLPLDRVASSVAAFDLAYLRPLGRRGVAAPTPAPPGAEIEPTTGGHVLEPHPGLWSHVAVVDFRSLYPSLIRTFGIDPLNRLESPDDDHDPIVAPNGVGFRRRPGILPRILDGLMPRRERARTEGDRIASEAIKILMNSFYGVLGTPACRFYDPRLANAITGFGREILLVTRDLVQREGGRVLYGDTDSLFVLLDVPDLAAARSAADALVARVDAALAESVHRRWRVPSRLRLGLDRLYARLFLPHARHGPAGARKRYVGLVIEGDERRVVFTGMESVRSDWTPLARRVQRELYERLFADREVASYLAGVVAALRAGRLDDQLVYRRTLRKAPESYTATTPPHVVAARLLGAVRGQGVRYVMTVDGPQPARDRSSPLDHEHYVQRQVRPVALPVLELLGLDFDRVIGDDRQLPLF